jgi:hypothetical protein
MYGITFAEYEQKRSIVFLSFDDKNVLLQRLRNTTKKWFE